MKGIRKDMDTLFISGITMNIITPTRKTLQDFTEIDFFLYLVLRKAQ